VDQSDVAVWPLKYVSTLHEENRFINSVTPDSVSIFVLFVKQKAQVGKYSFKQVDLTLKTDCRAVYIILM